MPIVPTWVSDDDYLKYLEIKKQGKSAWKDWVHYHLHQNPTSILLGESITASKGEVINIGSPQTVISKKNVAGKKVNQLCKHGFPPEFCRYAKPGKPCK